MTFHVGKSNKTCEQEQANKCESFPLCLPSLVSKNYSIPPETFPIIDPQFFLL